MCMPGAMYVTEEEAYQEETQQQEVKKPEKRQDPIPIKLRVDFDHETDGLATVS